MKLRAFNDAGITTFQNYLAALRTDPSLAVPDRLLVDDAFSDEIDDSVEFEVQPLDTRLDAAKYLWTLLEGTGLKQPERNKGLWAWLSLCLFSSTCPAEANGARKPGADARHIPEVGNYLRYYRHLLLGPYIIYRAHRDSPESAMALLCQKLNRPGDVVEQLSARQQRISNRTFLAVASKFYVDQTGRQRRGAQSKTRGSALRLVKVANQFDVNWYLYAMKPDEFVSLLPKEFDKFKTAKA
jgi:hypothetical protein